MVADAAEAAAAIGVDFCQAHSPDGKYFAGEEERANLLLATQRSIEACAMLGIPAIVVHACPNPEHGPKEFKEANRDFYRNFFATMEKHNVTVLIENGCEINSPCYYLRTGAEMKEFLEYANHPLLQACWDTGHAHMRAMDQYESILTLGSSLRGLHIQDNYGDRDSHTAPFFGNCNFDPIMQALLDIGYRGAFAFEGSWLLRNHQDWPGRKPWNHKGRDVTTLLDVPLHIKLQGEKLLYAIGKHILEQYHCFEE